MVQRPTDFLGWLKRDVTRDKMVYHRVKTSRAGLYTLPGPEVLTRDWNVTP